MTPEQADAAAVADLDAEREHVEALARAHAAVAAAQDRSYWLDRWGIDLNELMRRPGGRRLRVALRVARRGQRLAIELQRQLAREAREAGEELAGAAATAGDPLDRAACPSALDAAPVTDLLVERLGDDGVAAVEAALTDRERAALVELPAHDRLRLLLSHGVHREVSELIDRTGLHPAEPPADVHAMGRGPAAAGGSPYYADLVADALAHAGLEIAPGMRGLDFGCSSGRVVRVLAAAFPEVEWHGCDPNGEAIAWAAANLPEARFAVAPQRPPLPFDAGALDFAFAISIWSHYAEGPAIDWLAEMHRAIRPGGMLALSAHGYQTIAHDHAHGIRSAEQLTEVQAALYGSGHWFKDEFGLQGDHGVVDSGWGTAFLTPEWLLARVSGNWTVAVFAPGRVEGNQDLYVLERR